ncbi:hypothetical protein WH8501_00605 [Crocosphaera watsonii WH 8501]|nr:hypothetical protein [Crocosphaera watsonii]
MTRFRPSCVATFSRGDKPVKTLIERGFQPWRSLYKLSKTRGLIENKQ